MQNDKAAALPPEWAWDRAYELARGVNHNVAFARYIAEHETAPVDPLLIEAREIAAKWNDAIDCMTTASLIREGSRDSNYVVQTALAALKRGIEIGKGEA